MPPPVRPSSVPTVNEVFSLAFCEGAQALVFSPSECLVQLKGILYPVEIIPEHIPDLISTLKSRFEIQETDGVTQQPMELSLMMGEKVIPARFVRIPPRGAVAEIIIVFFE